MIAPLEQFPVKGVIWYQGEANAKSYERCVQYRTLFTDMITAWRTRRNHPDMYFFFVQLAAFRPYNREPEDPFWAWLREAQTMALTLPHTGMALAIDAGLEKDIHPPYKQIIGERLAAIALSKAYDKSIVYSGPMFDTAKTDKSTITITFKNTGNGLIAKKLSLGLDGEHTAPGGTLTGFTICGKDKVFYSAKAVIQNNTVIVSSRKVKKPETVRYAWANFPIANLYNKEGFPAVPFRTDTYEGMVNK
jgi:sialate O-acetylesterase